MSSLTPDLAAEAKAVLIRLHEAGIMAALVGLLPEGNPLVVCQSGEGVVPLCELVLAAYAKPAGSAVN